MSRRQMRPWQSLFSAVLLLCTCAALLYWASLVLCILIPKVSRIEGHLVVLWTVLLIYWSSLYWRLLFGMHLSGEVGGWSWSTSHLHFLVGSLCFGPPLLEVCQLAIVVLCQIGARKVCILLMHRGLHYMHTGAQEGVLATSSHWVASSIGHTCTLNN